MGSEQSTGGGAGRADRQRAPETPVSPQNSICSDVEVPYVSYTHNQPIGEVESPRSVSRRPRPGRLRGIRAPPLLPKEIVVVRAAGATGGGGGREEDPELRRLRLIPTFLPVMRGALGSGVAGRDPDVLERLDSDAVRQMAGRLQRHLAACADRTATAQASITFRIGQLDQQSATLLSRVTERQRQFARHAERLQKVGEAAHAARRCRQQLDDTLRELQQLNQQLPEQRQLPAFLWSSG